MSNAPRQALRQAQLEERMDYVFRDRVLLEQALTHRSAGRDNNERLEFLGDSLINHVVALALFERFPTATEGQLSRLRAKLVRGTYLAVIAQHLDVGDCLILGTGERKSGGRHRDSILADALEAVAGSILLDAGFSEAQTVVLGWFSDALEALELGDERDPKTRLQEWLQGRGQALPEYVLERVTGADHEQVFEVSCRVQTLEDATLGQGRSRRQAEQAAATRALEALSDD